LKRNAGWKIYTGFDGQRILCRTEAEGSTRIWHWSRYRASSIHSTTTLQFFTKDFVPSHLLLILPSGFFPSSLHISHIISKFLPHAQWIA